MITSVSAYSERSFVNPARMARVTSASLDSAKIGISTPFQNPSSLSYFRVRHWARPRRGNAPRVRLGAVPDPREVLDRLRLRAVRSEDRRERAVAEEDDDLLEVLPRGVPAAREADAQAVEQTPAHHPHALVREEERAEDPAEDAQDEHDEELC